MSEDVELGIGSIDAQHQELVELFGDFAHAIKSDCSFEMVHDIVQRALAAANAHFAHEEDLIERTQYPRAEDHKRHHRRMRMEFTTLAGSVMATMTHDPIAVEHLEDMLAMLRDHIGGPDRELAEHLKAAGIR